jgi:hypothetical protein
MQRAGAAARSLLCVAAIVSSGIPGCGRRVAAVAASALLAAACAAGVPTGASQPFFHPSRITVQDVKVTPDVAPVGASATIQFRLVRAADEGQPIFWTAHVLERPLAGGTLSALAGGPLKSGGGVDLVYTPAGPTQAVITIYPSSTSGTLTGDGSGDWRAISIEAR